MTQFTIAASILSADFARLGQECEKVLKAGADWIHFDVMDNHYVPNLTVGPLVCKALRAYGISAPIDVHLMVTPVDSLIVDFAKAGATYISFHPEASLHIDRSLQLIRDNGCKSALVLNPATPLSCLEHVLDKIDMLLIMSVNPGFAGQKFIASMLPKIKKARTMIDELQLPLPIAVDGGIGLANIGDLAKAGADIFVIGSTIFQSFDYYNILQQLRNILELN